MPRKPVLHLDLAELDHAAAASRLRHWLATVQPTVLNVAGPRASDDPEIAGATACVLGAVLL